MASSTAFLGLDRLKRGEQSDLNELEPLYLRKTDFARQPPSRPGRTAPAETSPSPPAPSGPASRPETSSE